MELNRIEFYLLQKNVSIDSNVCGFVREKRISFKIKMSSIFDRIQTLSFADLIEDGDESINVKLYWHQSNVLRDTSEHERSD